MKRIRLVLAVVVAMVMMVFAGPAWAQGQPADPGSQGGLAINEHALPNAATTPAGDRLTSTSSGICGDDYNYCYPPPVIM